MPSFILLSLIFLYKSNIFITPHDIFFYIL
nr:MAG TPA: hypothetical protein [Caudoviricetes sp.]